MNSIALSATLVAALGASAVSNESAKPNIVVIVTDDQGYADISFNPHHPKEAVEFIERSKGRPFFLYLAYNAVHAPPQAPEEDVERFKRQFPELSDTRATLMAMLYHLDLGVGNVVQKLKETGAWQNTLMFFLTDR